MRSLGILGQLCFVLYYTFRAHVGLIIAFFFGLRVIGNMCTTKRHLSPLVSSVTMWMLKELGPFTLIESALIWFFLTGLWTGSRLWAKHYLVWRQKALLASLQFFLHPCWTWKLLFQWDFMSFHSFGFAILTVVLGWMFIISSFFQSNVGLLKMLFKNCPNTVCPSSTRGNPVCYYIGICDGECGSCTFSSGVC